MLVVFVVSPFLGVLVLAAVVPIENILVVAEGVTASRLLGIAVACAWILRKLLTGDPWKPVLRNTVAAPAALFIVFAFASSLWAADAQLSLQGSFQLIQMMVWSLLIVDVASSWRKLDVLVKAFVLGALLAAVFTLRQYFSGEADRAGDMVSGGVNATAGLLTVTLPLGFYLFRSGQVRSWVWCGLGYVVLAGLASIVTFARMSFLVLPVLLLILLWDTFRSTKSRTGMLALACVVTVGVMRVVPWDAVEHRANTIAPYLGSEGESAYQLSPNYRERVYHFVVGLAIAADHPVLGGGYGNYGLLLRDKYQHTVEGSPRTFSSIRSPHNTFFAILADLGLVGLLLWGLLLWSVVRGTWRGHVRLRPHGTNVASNLTRLLVLSLIVGALPYGLYLQTQREKFFWLLIGMCSAAGELALNGRKNKPLVGQPR